MLEILLKGILGILVLYAIGRIVSFAVVKSYFQLKKKQEEDK